MATHRFSLSLFACLQNALVGGIVFGWASIDRTMLKAPEEEGGANLTPSETTLLFTVASSTASLAPLFLGPLLDAYGPRACLVASHLFVVLGCGGFSLSRDLWEFALSVILIAFGGPGIGKRCSMLYSLAEVGEACTLNANKSLSSIPCSIPICTCRFSNHSQCQFISQESIFGGELPCRKYYA